MASAKRKLKTGRTKVPVGRGHGRPLGGFRGAAAGVREERGRQRSELVGGQEVGRLMWAAGLGRGWAEKPGAITLGPRRAPWQPGVCLSPSGSSSEGWLASSGSLPVSFPCY